MLGKIWGKRGIGYLEQVMTAGILLTVATVLIFVVFGTLRPVSNPPIANSLPAAESSQTIPMASQQPSSDSLAEKEQLPASVQQPQLAQQAIAVTTEGLDTGEETIRDLWAGTIIREFGWQLHPLYNDWRYHNGLDISGGDGQIVPALLNGEIVDVINDAQYGLTIAVKSGEYTLYYGSLASVAVHKNTSIRKGKAIGSMGISASELTPHLHLTVKTLDGKQAIDPRELFPGIQH